jgi:hypothetical protein
MREKFRQFLKSPLFQPRYDLTLEEERELGESFLLNRLSMLITLTFRTLTANFWLVTFWSRRPESFLHFIDYPGPTMELALFAL